MKYRLYTRGTADAQTLDRILGPDHGISINRDRLVVAVDDDNLPTGCLIWRPCAFIHELRIPDGLGQMSIANSLMREAIRLDINRRHAIDTALFIVDSHNHRMLRYVRDEVKATEQSGVVFTLNLKAPGVITNENDGQAR